MTCTSPWKQSCRGQRYVPARLKYLYDHHRCSVDAIDAITCSFSSQVGANAVNLSVRSDIDNLLDTWKNLTAELYFRKEERWCCYLQFNQWKEVRAAGRACMCVGQIVEGSAGACGTAASSEVERSRAEWRRRVRTAEAERLRPAEADAPAADRVGGVQADWRLGELERRGLAGKAN